MQRSLKLTSQVSRTGEPALSHWAFAAQAMRMKNLREWNSPRCAVGVLDPAYLISPCRGSFPFVPPRLERPGGFGARLSVADDLYCSIFRQHSCGCKFIRERTCRCLFYLPAEIQPLHC